MTDRQITPAEVRQKVSHLAGARNVGVIELTHHRTFANLPVFAAWIHFEAHLCYQEEDGRWAVVSAGPVPKAQFEMRSPQADYMYSYIASDLFDDSRIKMRYDILVHTEGEDEYMIFESNIGTVRVVELPLPVNNPAYIPGQNGQFEASWEIVETGQRFKLTGWNDENGFGVTTAITL